MESERCIVPTCWTSVSRLFDLGRAPALRAPFDATDTGGRGIEGYMYVVYPLNIEGTDCAGLCKSEGASAPGGEEPAAVDTLICII